MNLIEAYTALDLTYDDVSDQDIKDNFRWLVKFYHPDNPDTGCVIEFKKVLKAYNLIRTTGNNGTIIR